MKRFDDKRFQGLLDTDRFGRKLVHLSTTASTNAYSEAILDDAGPLELETIDGTLILSDEQTGGRGRFNRQWLSPPGGLWFSLIFKTGLSRNKMSPITLIIAYSAAKTLMKEYDISVCIKWPNDLYSKDRKFGGILSEEKRAGSHHYMIIGMGLNIEIKNSFIEGLDNKAVNLQELTTKTVGPEKLLAGTLNRFEKSYLHYLHTGDFKSIFKKIEKILKV